MLNEPIFYLNGKFVPKSKALISVFDLGWLKGYGVFDYTVTYFGRPFLLKKHIKRLINSAKIIGLKIPYNEKGLEQIVIKTLNKNGKEKGIRIVLTGCVSEDTQTLLQKPTLAVIITNRKRYSKLLYEKRAKVITYKYLREIPQSKSLNYIQATKALNLAARCGAVEAFYINKKEDKIYGGATSNLFLVKEKKISTPDGETLPGITRNLVIRLSKKYYPVKIRKISIDELFHADEVFISATNKEAMPVVKIDNNIIGSGKPGEVTKKIMEEFRNFIKNKRW